MLFVILINQNPLKEIPIKLYIFKKLIIMYSFLKKNYYYLILLVFIFFLFNTFLHVYIMINSNYDQRMIKYGGFCNDQAYGFVQFINNKYNKLKTNFNVLNYLDLNPSSYGYFYNIKKKINNKYIILIGITDIQLQKLLLNKNFNILEKKNNCYFIKIND